MGGVDRRRREAGGLRRNLDRWLHRHRAKFAVLAAFVIACLMGLAAASASVETLSINGQKTAASPH